MRIPLLIEDARTSLLIPLNDPRPRFVASFAPGRRARRFDLPRLLK